MFLIHSTQKIPRKSSILTNRKEAIWPLFYFSLNQKTMVSNKNIVKLKPSATLLINEKVKELRKKGKKLTHFGFGQSPFPIHKSIVEELKKYATNNHYLPVNGLQVLREQLSKFLFKNQGIERDSALIFIGPGSKELLYQSILIFEGEYLIPKGSWVSYIPQIKSKGGSYTILETKLENQFKLTAETLEGCLQQSKQSKQQESILILNSPNNPTGAVYTEEEYASLAKVCKKYQVIVFSDEIYSQINFNDDFSPSISKFYPEGTLVFGGLSKVFSAGGYRLGFMSLPEELASLSVVYRSLFSETFSCVSSPIQFAGVKAYEYAPKLKEYVNISSKILHGVSSFIFDEFSKNNILCTQSRGAFYMMIGFDNFKEAIQSLNITTSIELAHYLLENYDVALLPGSDFGFQETELFFRLAFVDFDGENIMNSTQEDTEIDKFYVQKNCPSVFRGVDQLVKFTKDLT